MAHCKAQETKHNPELRRFWKFSLIRRLYERGYARQDVLNLFHFIDWLMQLLEPLEKRFWQDLWELEAAKKMTYVTSVERYAEKRGLEKGREEELEKGLEAVTRLLLRLLEYIDSAKFLKKRLRDSASCLLNKQKCLWTQH